MVQEEMKTVKEALGDVLEDDDVQLLEEENGSDDGDNGNRNGNSDDDDDDDGKILSKTGAASGIKHNKYDDDDEDYSEKDNNEDEEEDSDKDDDEEMDENDLVPESDDDDIIQNGRGRHRRSTRNTRNSARNQPDRSYREVDEEGIGTADEGSSDEETGPSLLCSPVRKSSGGMSYGSPSARHRARAMGRRPLEMQEGGDESESESDGRKKKQRSKRKRRKIGKSGSDDDDDYGGASDYNERGEEGDDQSEDEIPATPSRKTKVKNPYSPTPAVAASMHCPSTHDEITTMPLPKNKPHICYVAPDGKTR